MRRPRKRRHPVLRAILNFFYAVFSLVLVALITFIIILFLVIRRVPSTIDLTFDPPGRTVIYSSDGVLLARMYVQNRQVVAIDQIPQNLQNATIAFEDKRFYTHPGVDYKGILRAIFKDVKSRDFTGQGGSTITQQLARNLGVDGLTRQKSLQRKITEWIVANQIERSYTKQRILEMYLNQVNYGSGAYGVQAAAETYFGKDVKDLDLAQCALLAGLPNRPGFLNPYHDMTAAVTQRNIVLSNMLAQGYITPQQFQQAEAEKTRLAGLSSNGGGSQIYRAPYFVNYVKEELRKKYGDDALAAGNMKVYTTLNWGMQQVAEKAVADGIAAGQGGASEACLVAMDYQTGEIKAMVGGSNFKHEQVNFATQAARQPGSCFKAIVYSAAIDSGLVSEKTTVYDGPDGDTYKVNGHLWTPHDDSGFSYDHLDLRSAMAYSVNVVAVKVLNYIGPDTAIRYAHVMGIDPDRRLPPVLSLALGSAGVTPLEMCDVYATIANGGNHPIPSPFTKVTDMDDNDIEDFPPAVETRVLQTSTVTQVDDMLRAVVDDPRGTGHMVETAVPDARGKTGTTQDHKDVWFIGYTKTVPLVCAVWAGHPSRNPKTGIYSYGDPLADNAWGGTVCAPIWSGFMAQAIPLFQKDVAKSEPPKPAVTPAAAAAAATAAAAAATGEPAPVHRYRRKNRPDDDTDVSTPPATGGSTDSNAPVDAAQPDDDGSGALSNATDASPTGVGGDTGSSGDLSPSSSFNGGVPPRTNDTASPDDAAPAAGTSSTPPPAVSLPESAPERPHHARPPQPKTPQYVTVRINPDDNLLATKWTPYYIEKTYVKGQEPHRYSQEYGAPPGEH